MSDRTLTYSESSTFWTEWLSNWTMSERHYYPYKICHTITL